MNSNQHDLEKTYPDEVLLRDRVLSSLSNMNKSDLRRLISSILIETDLRDRKQNILVDNDTKEWANSLIDVFEENPRNLWLLMSVIDKVNHEISQNISEHYSNRNRNQVPPENGDTESSRNSSELDDFKKTWNEFAVGDTDFDSYEFEANDYPWNNPKVDETEAISEYDAKDLENHIDMLIITASPTERDSVLNLLESYSDRERVLKFPGDPTCYFGQFGSHTAIVIMCDSRNILDTYIQIDEVERRYKPRAAIMVGIACGRSSKSQKIGDILISSALIPCDSKRSEPDGTVFTASPVESNRMLKNLFTDRSDWSFPRPDKYKCKIHTPGYILTGSTLHNDLTEKVKLFQFSNYKPIGLEMEGYALHKASAKNHVPWILVKAISDWGNGEKDKDQGKDRPYRKLAAAAAASFVHYKLKDKNALAAFERKP